MIDGSTLGREENAGIVVGLVCASNSEVFQIVEQTGQGARVVAMGLEDGRWDHELESFEQNEYSLSCYSHPSLRIFQNQNTTHAGTSRGRETSREALKQSRQARRCSQRS